MATVEPSGLIARARARGRARVEHPTEWLAVAGPEAEHLIVDLADGDDLRAVGGELRVGDAARVAGQERREHGRVVEVAPHRGLIRTADQQTVAGRNAIGYEDPANDVSLPDRLTGGDVDDTHAPVASSDTARRRPSSLISRPVPGAKPRGSVLRSAPVTASTNAIWSDRRSMSWVPSGVNLPSRPGRGPSRCAPDSRSHTNVEPSGPRSPTPAALVAAVRPSGLIVAMVTDPSVSGFSGSASGRADLSRTARVGDVPADELASRSPSRAGSSRSAGNCRGRCPSRPAASGRPACRCRR